MIAGNRYPGRGILLGQSENAQHGVLAYFIMGRSENSRNRVFFSTQEGFAIRIFKQEKLTDASLILYTPLRRLQDSLIITNGDQTDTIYDGMHAGKTFEDALESRCFEPDAPNYTPRISGIFTHTPQDLRYKLSILKAGDPAGNTCVRNTFCYEAQRGTGRLIHTYSGDGNPLPSFCGEPEQVPVKGDLKQFAASLWNQLDKENRVALYVRYTSVSDMGVYQDIIFNALEGD